MMKLLSLLVTLMSPLVIGSQDQYNCFTDGVPTIIIDAGQGTGPVVEFFFPLFADCFTAQNNVPHLLSPTGTPLLTGPSIPNSATNLAAVGVADQDGFTGTDTAIRLAKFFPLSGISCQALISGGQSKGFSSATPVDLGEDGEAAAIEFLTCTATQLGGGFINT
ncbi:hypothetical protein K469DRAFT_690755 [Zopfia rhizophila CBS 207.26]|uniref:Carbohydrate esterase family 5 protein n=1 Tax=Zopfia rhizophila CBS 207.26 TaxID=1314779 RepID=A0A6A6DSS5_9PEZI|nr:hypothetical protein K469DRAFT_690755 [Zopfia rhizophila CBS 207.26]